MHTEQGLPKLKRLGLSYNPFPPATAGVAFVEDIVLPKTWERDLKQHLESLAGSAGDKALAVVGGYGSGKTFILNWIAQKSLPGFRVQPYFFDNPGVAFYDLANHLMRRVGRYELSKALWEMFYKSGNRVNGQGRLIPFDFNEWLATLGDRSARSGAIEELTRSIRQSGLATDEEIANKFARVVVETRERPYYEYRDFVPRAPKSIVAEREEASYFRSLIRILQGILGVQGIAFLIDEFEDVAMARRLTKAQAAAYVSTMRRLLDTAREEDLWIILATTPEGLRQTIQLDQSLLERFTGKYEILPLSIEDAREIVVRRLKSARLVESDGLSPFPDDALCTLNETTRSSPRRLIKVLWHTVALAMQQNLEMQIPVELLLQAEAQLYPEET